MNMPVNTIILLVIIAVPVFLQFLLSKTESRWPGLIIPFISFVMSIVAVMSMAVFSTSKTITTKTTDENGIVISEQQVQQGEKPSALETAAAAVPVFLMYNIPTAVYLGIYAACRDKTKKKNVLFKMKVQDL